MVYAVAGTRSRKKVWGASLILGANRAGISSLLSKPAVPTKISHLPLPVLLLGLRGIFFIPKLKRGLVSDAPLSNRQDGTVVLGQGSGEPSSGLGDEASWRRLAWGPQCRALL